MSASPRSGAGQHLPRLIFWEVTKGCNLRCVHCRATATELASPNDLPTDQALNIIDQIAAARAAYNAVKRVILERWPTAVGYRMTFDELSRTSPGKIVGISCSIFWPAVRRGLVRDGPCGPSGLSLS